MKKLLSILMTAAIALPAMADRHEKGEHRKKAEHHPDTENAKLQKAKELKELRPVQERRAREHREKQKHLQDVEKALGLTQKERESWSLLAAKAAEEDQKYRKLQRQVAQKELELRAIELNEALKHRNREEEADRRFNKEIHREHAEEGERREIGQFARGVRERVRGLMERAGGLRERELRLKEWELKLKEREIDLKAREVDLGFRELTLRERELDLKAKALEAGKLKSAAHSFHGKKLSKTFHGEALKKMEIIKKQAERAKKRAAKAKNKEHAVDAKWPVEEIKRQIEKGNLAKFIWGIEEELRK